jgi:hypothetical protein
MRAMIEPLEYAKHENKPMWVMILSVVVGLVGGYAVGAAVCIAYALSHSWAMLFDLLDRWAGTLILHVIVIPSGSAICLGTAVLLDRCRRKRS